MKALWKRFVRWMASAEIAEIQERNRLAKLDMAGVIDAQSATEQHLKAEIERLRSEAEVSADTLELARTQIAGMKRWIETTHGIDPILAARAQKAGGRAKDLLASRIKKSAHAYL